MNLRPRLDSANHLQNLFFFFFPKSPTKIPPPLLTVTYGTASCTTVVAPLTESLDFGLKTEKGSGRTRTNIHQTLLWGEALQYNEEDRLSIAMGRNCTQQES